MKTDEEWMAIIGNRSVTRENTLAIIREIQADARGAIDSCGAIVDIHARLAEAEWATDKAIQAALLLKTGAGLLQTAAEQAIAERDAALAKLAAAAAQRDATRAMLRIECAEHGCNDWPDNLHLADVIEKHLARTLVAQRDAAISALEKAEAKLVVVAAAMVDSDKMRLDMRDERDVARTDAARLREALQIIDRHFGPMCRLYPWAQAGLDAARRNLADVAEG